MRSYYNENDPFAAAWLRELIKDDLIAPGDVDERSIRDVTPDDLSGYTQHHFFAGIGGWSYALRLAGWPDDQAVWTGSCPCQSFSNAGRGTGFADRRHLWPVWFALIRKCRPEFIFGEQVDAAIRHRWLDLVQDDLEGVGYTCGATVFPACSLGAPHIRQRLYWVAHDRLQGSSLREQQTILGAGRGQEGGAVEQHRGASGGVDNTEHQQDHQEQQRPETHEGGRGPDGPGGRSVDCWSDSIFHVCRDGKARPVPVESALQPLADGIPNRVGMLRGAGNAIVPAQGAAFIEAFTAWLDNQKPRRNCENHVHGG